MFKSNQLLALLKVGHEVDTAAKAPAICEPVSIASSWQNF